MELSYVEPVRSAGAGARDRDLQRAHVGAARAAFGSDAWFANGDGFSVDFELLSRISPFGRRDDGKLVVRTPFSGLSISDPTPGTIASSR